MSVTSRYPVLPTMASLESLGEMHDRTPTNVQLPPSPPAQSEDDHDRPQRPSRLKRPESDSSIQTRPVIHQLPTQARNKSPSTLQARPHTSLGLPMLMQRAHSSPGVDSSGRFVTPYHTAFAPRRPTSPLSSGRRRSPMRSAMDESYPVSWSGLAIEPNIPEHAELDLSEHLEDLNISPLPTYTNTLPRSRRRPTSPLHASASAPSLNAARSELRATSPHAPGTSSPQLRYYPNDMYAGSFSLGSASVSSMPSTPSSFRSRSPSISSLETIEDTPDAEEAAEEDAKYREQMGEPADLSEGRRRSSEGSRRELRSNKERKRWSVCGAERRADFSLEVIEE